MVVIQVLHVVETGEWYAHAFGPVWILFQNFHRLSAIPSVADTAFIIDVGQTPYLLARTTAKEGLIVLQVVVACPDGSPNCRVFHDDPVVYVFPVTESVPMTIFLP